MLKIITTDDAGPIVLQLSLPELMLQEQTETGHVQSDPENTEKTLKRGDGTIFRQNETSLQERSRSQDSVSIKDEAT